MADAKKRKGGKDNDEDEITVLPEQGKKKRAAKAKAKRKDEEDDFDEEYADMEQLEGDDDDFEETALRGTCKMFTVKSFEYLLLMH